MKLNGRLLKISELVSSKKIADIGTDHGYIPTYLLSSGKIDFAILSDVNKGPLENAKKEVESKNLENKVSLRLGSGIDTVEPFEVDEVIIAGMGGILISEILESKKEVSHNLKKLILQPMQAQSELRKYLLNNGYEIIDEVLVKEDFRIYEIIVCKYSNKNTKVDEIYYEVGEKLIQNKDELLNEFIDKKIYSYNQVIEKIKNNENMKSKKENIQNKIKLLESLKLEV